MKKKLTSTYGDFATTDITALLTSQPTTTKMIWIESPSNPLLKVLDIQAISTAMHSVFGNECLLGRYRWDLYFRTERGNLPLMVANGHGLTGTSAGIASLTTQDGNAQSLTGAMPTKVTTMEGMFEEATEFISDLDFDTSLVTNMKEMFHEASKFNGDISKFNTAKVTTMYSMFANANSFNNDIVNQIRVNWIRIRVNRSMRI